MYGRYGTDKLNVFLAVFLLILGIVSIFVTGVARLVIQILETLVFIVFILRFLSKNTARRRAENEKFLKIFTSVEKFFKLKMRQAKDKNFKYFKCPKCSATLRVPRKKGNITVTCPVCNNKFDKRT
jgi:hypothetical protein